MNEQPRGTFYPWFRELVGLYKNYILIFFVTFLLCLGWLGYQLMGVSVKQSFLLDATTNEQYVGKIFTTVCGKSNKCYLQVLLNGLSPKHSVYEDGLIFKTNADLQEFYSSLDVVNFQLIEKMRKSREEHAKILSDVGSELSPKDIFGANFKEVAKIKGLEAGLQIITWGEPEIITVYQPSRSKLISEAIHAWLMLIISIVLLSLAFKLLIHRKPNL